MSRVRLNRGVLCRRSSLTIANHMPHAMSGARVLQFERAPRSTSCADIGDGTGLKTCNSIPSLSGKYTSLVGLT